MEVIKIVEHLQFIYIIIKKFIFIKNFNKYLTNTHTYIK